jgi:hypothetical protein
MGKEPKTPNLTLKRIREQEPRMTRVEFAEALGLKAYELEPSEPYITRLDRAAHIAAKSQVRQLE